MTIKMTLLGYLIYASMGAYTLALLLTICRQVQVGRVIFAIGSLFAVAAFVDRWISSAHVPMQNLFDVFLCMGVLVGPISLFSRRALGVRLQWADMVLGILILFPCGFVLESRTQLLPPALQCWLFGPHVAVYMLSYVLMAKAAVQAGAGLVCTKQETVDFEISGYRMVCLGFPLMTAGLVLGSWWGHLAWGDYWGWDPKELWSLASWLIFLVYLHWRCMYGRRFKRINNALVLLGFASVVITLLWVNLSRIFAGLHSYAV